MIYQVSILTFLMVFVLTSTKVFPYYAPRVVIGGQDIGAYVGLVFVFAFIWFIVWFSERSTGRPAWLQSMRYRQGASLYFDWAILALVVVFVSVAIGARTLSNYMFTGSLCAIAAVIESVWLRAEPTLPPSIDLENMAAQDTTEPRDM